MDAVKAKRECRLCGYPSTDYRIIPVPLASPPQDNVVCADCLEELMDAVVAERDEAREQVVTLRAREAQLLAKIQAFPQTIADEVLSVQRMEDWPK